MRSARALKASDSRSTLLDSTVMTAAYSQTQTMPPRCLDRAKTGYHRSVGPSEGAAVRWANGLKRKVRALLSHRQQWRARFAADRPASCFLACLPADPEIP